MSERFEVARNFSNKLWNAARFALMRLEGYEPGTIDLEQLTIEDRWILSRLSTVTAAVTQRLDEFSFHEVARLLYDFCWQDFCSFYVEMLKERLSSDDLRPQAQRMLAFVLDQLLRLLHPIMPFVTEEIWQLLRRVAPQRGLPEPQACSEHLIVASWPAVDSSWQQAEIEDQFRLFESALGALREIRAKQNLAPRKEIKFVVRCEPKIAALLNRVRVYFESMAAAQMLDAGPSVESPKPAANLNLAEMEIIVDLTGLIDVAAELERLEKEQARLKGAIAGTQGKLSNAAFVSKAPEEVVQKFREGLEQNTEQLKIVEAALEELKKSR
jgi:valyl-tRNA synthetase